VFYFLIGSPMPGPWGPLQMMYPPWMGWYGPWRLLHKRWPLQRCHPIVDQAGKSDNPECQIGPSGFPEDNIISTVATQAISAKIRGCSEFGGNQDQVGLKSETLANGEAMPDAEKGSEVVAAKQNKAQNEKTKVKAKAVASYH
jgi:hypothetical protein